MLYSVLKPLLFTLDPEDAHNLTLQVAGLSPILGKLSGITPDPRLALSVGNCQWSFPVGLAAGLDKNGEALEFFDAQGFGAIECGTVTLRPQEGNPRPRIFRYPEEESLRNAMGFPNKGLSCLYQRLQFHRGTATLGVNIGKNKETSPEESIGELSLLLQTLSDYAGYFVVNVSSPNTPGLRAMQEKSYLSELFSELSPLRAGKDLYLKIAPDLSHDKVVELTGLAEEAGLTGIIATNTTIMPERGTGGVSGVLLKEKAWEIRKIILKEKQKIELIAVGGITHPEDLFDLWKAGGKAAQIYTAYIFQGPHLLHQFKREILKLMDRQQLTLEEFFKLSPEERKYRLA